MIVFNQPAGHLLTGHGPAPLIELYESDDTGAVYVNGKLADGPGSIDNRYEYLLHGFGVRYVIEPAAFKDPHGDDVPATTTAIIKDRISTRELAKRTAADLRKKAAAMLAEADEIDPNT